MTKKQPVSPARALRVGFDLDGVILYNPARIVRPLIASVKKKLLKKNRLGFYYPRTGWEKVFWRLCHWSSFFVASGLDEIKRLSRVGKISPYIITARFDYLKNDFYDWIRRLDAGAFTRGCYYNRTNDQPHLFKEKMIDRLKLDVFVEDNWDIVRYLNDVQKRRRSGTKIFWIYNIFDKNINYPYKFPSLKSAVSYLKKL
ncbi:hypothetical protein M1523_00310 [Patescibacteria group bacterium]|nr:hypothetical protein [Patescibacteria group bacterium]MCL5091921.1 hypothetical protein [Patescibacteria group bacterium]